MIDAGEHALIVLYDGECGFCKVILAVLLSWDRARRLEPVPIESARGERLLAEVAPGDRLASWHLVDGACAVHSGGAGIPIVLAALPGGAPLAATAARFPRTTSRAYCWVASRRAQLGRFLGGRARAWASRVVDERER